LSRIKNN